MREFMQAQSGAPQIAYRETIRRRRRGLFNKQSGGRVSTPPSRSSPPNGAGGGGAKIVAADSREYIPSGEGILETIQGGKGFETVDMKI